MKLATAILLQNHDVILQAAQQKVEALEALVDQYRIKVSEVIRGILQEMQTADEERLYVHMSGFSHSIRFKSHTLARVSVDKKQGAIAVIVDETLVYTAIIGSDSIETFSEDNEEIQTVKKVILDAFGRNLTTYRKSEIEKL